MRELHAGACDVNQEERCAFHSKRNAIVKKEEKIELLNRLVFAFLTRCSLNNAIGNEAGEKVPIAAITATNVADVHVHASSAKDKLNRDEVSFHHLPQLLSAQYTWMRQHQSTLSAPYSGPLSLNSAGDIAASHIVGAYIG